jgi:PAS domain S-box-containing protein
MEPKKDEEELLKSAALQTASSILAARRRAERELTKAKDAFEAKSAELSHVLSMMSAMLESTTDSIAVTDDRGCVTAWNQKLLEMWHIPNEVIDSNDLRKVRDIMGRHFANSREFREKIEEIYATSPPETFDVLEMTDGRVIERYSKVQRVEGRNVGRVWCFRDITALRKK